MTTTDTLLDALDLESLPADEQEALLLDLNALIVRGSLVRMMEGMDEPTHAAFAALMETGAGEDAIQAFLKERVPGADQAVTETVQELTDDILSVSNPN